MYKQKIGISVGNNFDIPFSKVLKLIKNAGFEAISPVWKSASTLAEIADIAGELGLEIQSLHAPFSKAADMWSTDIKFLTL